MALTKTIEAASFFAIAVATLIGAIGGGSFGFYLQHRSMSTWEKALDMAGFGGAAIFSAPVIACALLGGFAAWYLTYTYGENASQLTLADEWARVEGFKDGPEQSVPIYRQ